MKSFIASLWGILAVAVLAACGTKPSEPTADHDEETHDEAVLTADQLAAVGVETDTVAQRNLTDLLKAVGVLKVPNANKAQATSLFSGVVRTLTVQVGDHVRKGQVIATISNPDFLSRQEALLAVRSRIVLAEQEWNRQKMLYEGNAGARRNWERATADLAALRAERSSLEQQLRLMGIRPERLTAGRLQSTLAVVSPLSGTVTAVNATVGGFVDASVPVAAIVDNSSLHLDLQVFERDLPKVKVGQEVSFVLTNYPSHTYTARVFSIGSSFENESKTIAVHCQVSGDKTGLIDGMNATGSLSLATVRRPAVPDAALVEDDGKTYIFVVRSRAADGDVTFDKIEVVRGVSDAGFTAITPVRELPRGAQVVTKGAFFINATLVNAGEHAH